MQKTLNAPVAFFIYKRPQETLQAFDSIRKARPQKLYIISDSASDKSEEEAVAKSRAIVETIDWDCDLKTHFAARHLGCRKRIMSGLEWLFSQVEEAIIVEDDIVASESFFYFCQEMLDAYRDHEHVFTISGCNIGFKSKHEAEDSYFFSNFMNMWGWATWKRAYEKIDFSLSHSEQYGWSVSVEQVLNYDIQWIRVWKNYYSLMKENKIDSWDYSWILSQLFYQGLSVIPCINMIQNIGYGDSATHTKCDSVGRAHLSVRNMSFPLKHPTQKKFCVNKEYEDFIKYAWCEMIRWSSFRLWLEKNAPKAILGPLFAIERKMSLRVNHIKKCLKR